MVSAVSVVSACVVLCRLVGGNVVIGALSSSKIKEKQKLEAEGRCP